MKVLGLVLAKGKSKGLIKKNFRKIGGLSLTEISLKNAKKSRLISRLIFSSESKELIKIAKKNSVESPFVRPKNLTKDNVSSYDVARHAVNFLKKTENWIPDYVVVLQPTTPFRKSSDIDKTILKTIKSKSDAGMSITKNLYSPFWALKKRNYLLPLFPNAIKSSNRQSLEDTFKPAGSIYVLKKSFLMKIKGILPQKKTIGVEVPHFASINIDSYEDYIYALYLHKHKIIKLDI